MYSVNKIYNTLMYKIVEMYSTLFLIEIGYSSPSMTIHIQNMAL